MNKKSILISFIAALILVACSNESDFQIKKDDVQLNNFSKNEIAITNYIKSKHKSDYRSRNNNIVLMPYIVKGDTTAFIVNYPEGGWEVFSNDTRLPMVLMKSKTGSNCILSI